MKLELDDEHRMLRDNIRAFAESEIRPKAAESDRTRKFPYPEVKKSAELGLMGVMVPEADGGSGMDALSYVLIIEEISHADASLGVILSVNNSLYCHPISKFGTPAQKSKYLAPFARGERLGCYCLTEADSGSDAGSLRTSARLEKDRWILDGSKVFVTNGVAADAAIVYAKTDPKAPSSKGISAFIVEKGFPGFSIGKPETKLGITSSGSVEIVLQNCEVPRENLLGEVDQGFRIALHTLDGGRIGIAAQALGIAQGAFDEALRYSKERKQFGVPISQHQAIQFYLADMATEIDAARLLAYRAAWAKDTQDRYTLEASMAKLFASEVANRVAYKAVQVFGGYGYINEYPVERYFRDARICELYEGTSEIQRLVISGQILKS
ncbi:MAG TPA: acyl-CoA dehydrogenase family protein [Candidatus Polarisedimenticolia bacterium]|nr:acyl-CoA dehydrogenase family protein [Candidatus Polarisedimenticolia bacterium]